MPISAGREIDRIVFDSGLVRVGAFRCYPDDPSFHDSGPARNCCFVFPRTAVEIQHEHERAFVANPNVVTFYNQGQAYVRNAVSIEGDRCDWFGVEIDVVQDVVRTFDPGPGKRARLPGGQRAADGGRVDCEPSGAGRAISLQDRRNRQTEHCGPEAARHCPPH